MDGESSRRKPRTPAVAGERRQPRLSCLALGLLAGLAACAGPSPDAGTVCTPAMGQPMLVAALFFGRAVPGRGDVTAQEWANFVDQVVTTNLPDGFTITDADGAWLNPATRRTIHEHSTVLTVALADRPDTLAALDRVAEAYQHDFHQQRVGRILYPACGLF